MQLRKPIILSLIVLLTLWAARDSRAQIILGGSNGEDSSWMTREIPAKKLAGKKFGFPRNVFQNLVTHYNFYYNTRSKLDAILRDAEAAHLDNYDSLLQFFPVTAEDILPMAGDLDSVIQNAGIGIEIHDPRVRWIDNLYLLAGQAYYYKGDYPHARAAFQHINTATAPRDAEGQAQAIGTRGFTAHAQLSVSTKEEQGMLRHVPSRNDALVWLARTAIAAGDFDQARGLLSVLAEDPLFPQRLQPELAALQSWFFFRQGLYGRGAVALERAVALQRDKKLRSRWQYLLAQCEQARGDVEQAIAHYDQAASLRGQPLMNFYARLNIAKLRISMGRQDFATGSQLLLAMARREKYARYRDIIYYNLGRLALQAGQPDEAIRYLQKSLSVRLPAQAMPGARREDLQGRAFTLLADTYYDQGIYRDARACYDSALAVGGIPAADAPRVNERSQGLAEVVKHMDLIDRQDSLQYLAGLPEDQLNAFLQRIVDDSLKVRRRRGRLLQGESAKGGKMVFGNAQAFPDLDSTAEQEGSWYFYNPVARSKGYGAFKSRWGNRPLADNWRGLAGTQAAGQVPAAEAAGLAQGPSGALSAGNDSMISVASLKAHLPLTVERKKISDDSIMEAWYALAVLFGDRLQDPRASFLALDTLLKRFPDNPHLAEAYFRLWRLYNNAGDRSRAAFYGQRLRQSFPDSRYTAAMQPAADTVSPVQRQVMSLYDEAYLSYLGGDYGRVARLRDSAMRLDPGNAFGARFDLMQAMATVKTGGDSAGQAALKAVAANHAADSGIAGQANAMLDALAHKQELIEHLMQLQLPEEPEEAPVAAAPVAAAPPPVQAAPREDTALARPAAQPAAPAPDTAQKRPDTLRQAPAPPAPAAPPPTPYKADTAGSHFVVLAFNRTDKRLIDEALSRFAAYNGQRHASAGIEVSSYLLGQNRVVLIFRLFPDEAAALGYLREISRLASSQIIPDIRPSDYRLFLISRDNFILLNNTKDYQGYLEFFAKHYQD